MFLSRPMYQREEIIKKKKFPFRSRTGVPECSFFPLSIEDWNNLPRNIVETALSELFLKIFNVTSKYRSSLRLE